MGRDNLCIFSWQTPVPFSQVPEAGKSTEEPMTSPLEAPSFIQMDLFQWNILVTGWWNPIIIYIYITYIYISHIYIYTPIYTNEINPFDSKSSARQRRFRSPPLSLQPSLGSLVTISTKCWEDMAFSGAKESEMQSLNSWIMLHAALRRDWKRPSWTIH